VVRLKSSDPAGAILDFARTHGVANIVVGRSQQPWWKQVLAGSVVMRLLREGAEFDLHVIALEPAPGASPDGGDALPGSPRGER